MDILELMKDDSMLLDTINIHKIESILTMKIIQDNIKETPVIPMDAEVYRGNFYGLIHNVYRIPNNAFFITMRINGYKSSIEYNGELIVKILHPDIMLRILEIIQRK